MKKTFFLFLILISIFSSYSQNVKNIKIPRKLPIIPPGTISINDSLYIDKAPVNNVMYHEFLKSVNTFWNLSIHDSIKKIPTFNLPKTFYSNNSKVNKDNELYGKINLNNNSTLINKITIDNYFNHPKYNYNPVLQISKEQAELYCKWRTDMVMLLWAIGTKTADERKRYPTKIKYRLPTKEEFELACLVFHKKRLLKTTKNSSPLKMKIEYRKEKFYLQNMSEFTLNESSYGQNWLNSKASSKANKYTSFRCICEIVK